MQLAASFFAPATAGSARPEARGSQLKRNTRPRQAEAGVRERTRINFLHNKA